MSASTSVTITDLSPEDDAQLDLGRPGKRFKDAYLNALDDGKGNRATVESIAGLNSRIEAIENENASLRESVAALQGFIDTWFPVSDGE